MKATSGQVAGVEIDVKALVITVASPVVVISPKMPA